MVESGDRLDKSAKENILFMPNHQSTADVPLCMTLFNARGNFAGRVMWIMDRVFKYSNFGCVSWMHDDFFILAVSLIFPSFIKVPNKGGFYSESTDVFVISSNKQTLLFS